MLLGEGLDGLGGVHRLTGDERDRRRAGEQLIEALDTSELGSAIGNKTGALDRVRADVAIIASKSGPIVIAAYTFDNENQRWTGDNEGQITLAKIGEAIVKAWSPTGLDPTVINWNNPLAPSHP